MNLLTSLLTLSAWALWGYTVLEIDPSVPLAPVLFYGTLFVALTGTLARLLGTGGGNEADELGRSPMPSFGHAASVSILLLFALWLQSLGMLTQLNGILLAATFGLIELGFRLSDGRPKLRARRRVRRDTIPDAGAASEQ